MRQRTRPPAHPGGLLKRQYLEPLGLSIAHVALAFGVSRKTLSKIVNERGAITPEMALWLSRAFQTTPEIWLNLQRNYDLWHAQQSTDWQHVKALAQSLLPLAHPSAYPLGSAPGVLAKRNKGLLLLRFSNANLRLPRKHRMPPPPS